MQVRNMRIRSYTTTVKVPSIRFMRNSFAIMRTAARVKMFFGTFLAYNQPFPPSDHKVYMPQVTDYQLNLLTFGVSPLKQSAARGRPDSEKLSADWGTCNFKYYIHVLLSLQ